MSDNKIKTALLDALLDIKNKPQEEIGICSQYALMKSLQHGAFYLIMKDHFVQWPKFSGNIYYPVPNPDKNASQPRNAGWKYNNTFDMWNKRTKYGRLRWELLEFMINTLQEELKK